DERCRDARRRGPLGAVDRLVAGVVDVARCRGLVDQRRYAREPIGLRRARDVDATEQLRRLDRLVRPDSGVAVIRRLGGPRAGLWYEREVVGRTCRHEQHRELVTDAADLADRRLGAFEYAAELLATMAVLEDPDSGSVEIPNRLLRPAQHVLGKD